MNYYCMMFPLFYTWMDYYYYYISILASLREWTPIILQPEKGVLAPPKSKLIGRGSFFFWQEFQPGNTHYYWVWTQDPLCAPRIPWYLGTLPNSTLIILFSEMLKFSKIISFQIKKILWRKIVNNLRIFHLLKWMFQN